MRSARLAVFGLWACTQVAGAQTAVVGVVASATGRPIADATIAHRFGSTRTDSAGHFRIEVAGFPDSIVVSAVGFVPDTVRLNAPPADTLRVTLVRLTLLQEIAVVAEREPQVARAERIGEWSLGQRAIRAAPAAIEADVFRSLSLVPAIGFSSILSARPILRGYEPNQAAIRVDGFEMPNLYRLGRILSSFPADATERVTVAAAPGAGLGPGLAGHIDIDGRQGAGDGFGGGGLSLGSLGAFGGGRPGGVDAFGAVRFLHVASLNLAAGGTVPASFIDGYGRLDFGAPGRRRGAITAFYSGDEYGDLSDQDGARWHSVLLAGRVFLVHDSMTTIELDAATARFSEDVANGPTQRVEVDVRTRLGKTGLGVLAQHRRGALDLEARLALGWRQVENAVGPSRNGFRTGFDFAPYAFADDYTELTGHAAARWRTGATELGMGLRAERTPWATVVAPRLSVGRRFGAASSLELAVGRTASLNHFVSDPASEPDLAYYDFWLPAGHNGVPAATLDHAVLDLRFRQGIATFRATGYLSAGSGFLEVRPPTSQRGIPPGNFRTGRSRTAGIETQVTLSPTGRPDRVASLIYVLGRSERDWGNGWVPWALDRRHLLRLQLASTIASRWRLDFLVDATSGPPFTPVTGLLSTPPVPNVSQVRYIYGPENSGRDLARVRADAGFTHHFNGPGGSRLFWGISLLNLTWGPVFPLIRNSSFSTDDEVIGYERIRRVPVIPTVTLRVEF